MVTRMYKSDQYCNRRRQMLAARRCSDLAIERLNFTRFPRKLPMNQFAGFAALSLGFSEFFVEPGEIARPLAVPLIFVANSLSVQGGDEDQANCESESATRVRPRAPGSSRHWHGLLSRNPRLQR